MNLFSIQNLCWAHGNTSPFFRHLNLTIPGGGIVAVHGDSGCGKTTLIQILGMLWERPISTGQVLFHVDGSTRDFATLSVADRNEFRQKKFGFILQNSFLIPHFSCSWNIALPRYLIGRSYPDGQRDSRSLLADDFQLSTPEAGLLEKLDTPAYKVSQGQRQRFNILRALANNPAVIFADEPTSNLDLDSSLFFFDVLKKWQRQSQPNGEPRSLIVISHNLEHSYKQEFLEAQWFLIMHHRSRLLNVESNASSHQVTVFPRSEIQSLEHLQELARNDLGNHR